MYLQHVAGCPRTSQPSDILWKATWLLMYPTLHHNTALKQVLSHSLHVTVLWDVPLETQVCGRTSLSADLQLAAFCGFCSLCKLQDGCCTVDYGSFEQDAWNRWYNLHPLCCSSGKTIQTSNVLTCYYMYSQHTSMCMVKVCVCVCVCVYNG